MKTGLRSGSPMRFQGVARTYFYGIALFLPICFDIGRGQNIVDLNSTTELTANPVTLTDKDVSEFFLYTADYQKAAATVPAADPLRRKLEAHVAELVEGAPWIPFHHTLGISGYEVYFNHPDELFYALGIATPFLTSNTAARVDALLKQLLPTKPPWSETGFGNRAGRARESYDVPAELRVAGEGAARSAFGVYAFWTYARAVKDDSAASRWPAVKERMGPLLTNAYQFDIRKSSSGRDEAEKVNGDIAGLIGFIRLARANKDAEAERSATMQLTRLLELRVNLERVNAKIVEPSRNATKRLHNFKLTRYCDLTPELGAALRKLTAGCAVAHLETFRGERNGWFLAFGDRMIGGENYTNPLHFSRSLFAGAAFVEEVPTEDLARFVDVPWCKADLYFIEKCVYALWAKAGRPWSEAK